MNPVLKKLWYPTEEDVLGSRWLLTISFPVLLLLGYLIKIPYIISLGFLLIFAIRIVMIIRGSMILPIPDDLVTKVHNRSKKNLNIIRFIAFTLPILSLISLIIIPKYFYISYIVSIFLSLSFLSDSRIPPVFYVIIFLFLSLSALAILFIQGSLFWIIIYLIFVLFGIPDLIAHYIKSKRLKVNIGS